MRIVHSSHGTLEIDDTGKVTAVHEDVEYLSKIERFDLEEYSKYYGESEHTEFDILDLGYWTTDGTYEPPVEDWRKHIEAEEVTNNARRQKTQQGK